MSGMARNAIGHDIAFQKKAKIQRKRGVALPTSCVPPGRAPMARSTASWAPPSPLPLSTKTIATSAPTPTPPKASENGTRKRTWLQRSSRSNTDSAGLSGFTQTVTGCPRPSRILEPRVHLVVPVVDVVRAAHGRDAEPGPRVLPAAIGVPVAAFGEIRRAAVASARRLQVGVFHRRPHFHPVPRAVRLHERRADRPRGPDAHAAEGNGEDEAEGGSAELSHGPSS